MNASERAAQIWPVLAYAAGHRQTITYGRLGQLIGVPHVGLGQLLEPVQSYCLLNELPPLTILVVQDKTGMPGTGFVAAQDIPGNQAAVFSFDWNKRPCPTPEAFADASHRLPSNGLPQAASERRSPGAEGAT